MHRKPADPPPRCPVCSAPHSSVSIHDTGLMVNLLDNDLFRRVCVEPIGGSRLRFYHHTHEQAATDTERGEANP
ncbi:hypothetical protein BRD17_00785 [Halobacteriales archaeon SW_7_68_16]|nr:MAG: hypothetical protein BRD17_00785 [Halobacteriales archaeon SW_7_68_16]